MTRWKLVPVEPAEEMLDAASIGKRNEGQDAELACLWEAMLSAAPSPPASEDRERVAREVLEQIARDMEGSTEGFGLVTADTAVAAMLAFADSTHGVVCEPEPACLAPDNRDAGGDLSPGADASEADPRLLFSISC